MSAHHTTSDGWPTPDAQAGDFGSPEDYSFAAMPMQKSAEEIEHERARRPVPPGDHEMIVVGFDKLKQGAKTAYYQGKEYAYTVMQVGVRLALASDPSCTILDYFDLPPAQGNDQVLYTYGSRNADGKNPGFMAEKFCHFIARIGWTYTKGQPFPEEATQLKNWKGRRVICTIVLEQEKGPDKQPKTDPSTGEPYPPRPQIKLFSYRPAAANTPAQLHAAPQPPFTPTVTAHAPTLAPPAPHQPATLQPPAAPGRLDQLKNLL